MGRYIHLKEKLYFDTKEKTIVRHMGNRYVFVRHDRRTRSAPVKSEKRASDRTMKSLLHLERNLFFDKKTNQIYKKTGDKLVLYSKDRRKQNKPVPKDRRKNKK